MKKPILLLMLVLLALFVAALPAEGRESPEDQYPLATTTPVTYLWPVYPTETPRHKPRPYLPPPTALLPTRTPRPLPTPVPTLGG